MRPVDMAFGLRVKARLSRHDVSVPAVQSHVMMSMASAPIVSGGWPAKVLGLSPGEERRPKI